MAYTDFDANEIGVYQQRLMEMHHNLGEIQQVLKDLGPDATVAVQLNSLDVYLPRLEIVILNAVAKAKSDQIQHKYNQPYPEREQKPATRNRKKPKTKN